MVTVYQYGSCTYSIVVICLISCIFFSLPPPLPPLPPFPSLPPPFSLFFILATTYNEPTSTAQKPLVTTVLCWWGGSRPSAYVGIVGLRVWTPTGELGISIPRGSRPSNRVGIVETYNYKHEIVLLA